MRRCLSIVGIEIDTVYGVVVGTAYTGVRVGAHVHKGGGRFINIYMPFGNLYMCEARQLKSPTMDQSGLGVRAYYASPDRSM